MGRHAVDQSQLRELLGDAELRELLDAESMDALERQLQRLDPPYQAKSADGVLQPGAEFEIASPAHIELAGALVMQFTAQPLPVDPRRSADQ